MMNLDTEKIPIRTAAIFNVINLTVLNVVSIAQLERDTVLRTMHCTRKQRNLKAIFADTIQVACPWR